MYILLRVWNVCDYKEQNAHVHFIDGPFHINLLHWINTVSNFCLTGDVVGPGFFVPHLNAENLMRRPYGCGEQNMFNFAVNLYNLKFLKVSVIA